VSESVAERGLAVGDRRAIMDGLLADLIVLPVGTDHFRCENAGRASMNLQHLFGGQVLAQALLAAGQTVDEAKSAHSLHAYFLRAGDPRAPIDYTVDRIREGRRLACRSVTASQDGRAIATVLTSFAETSGGVAHSIEMPPDPGPDGLPDLMVAAERWGGLGESWLGLDSVDVRVQPRVVERDGQPARAENSDDHVWLRTVDVVTDSSGGPAISSALLHAALITYMSDIMLLAAALVPHGVALGMEYVDGLAWGGVSVDHAVWFHRPAPADDWLLFAQNSPYAGDGRCLNTASVFDRSGQLVATTNQEGLVYGM
jgi:acyl-CoA thioesterase-2